MAKSPSGLPSDFDLSVSAEELINGPAQIAGYLDDDPVLAFAVSQRAKVAEPETVVSDKVVPQAQVPALGGATQASHLKIPPAQEEGAQRIAPASRLQPNQLDRKRFQINLDAESERMLGEMLDLLSGQSGENRIKISELFQALLLTVFNAKGEIALGSLPVRGRWGSPTAKAFPVNLAQALREAIIAHEQISGGNPFKLVAGIRE